MPERFLVFIPAYNCEKQVPRVLNQLDELTTGPKDCVGCGSCAHHCPLNIDIPALMKKIAAIER